MATLIPKSEICVIKNGRAETASSVWAGNQQAFQKFQQIWVPRSSGAIIRDDRSRLMSNAFRAAMEAGVENVGDLQISVGSKNGYFTYKSYTRIYYPKQTIQPEEKELCFDNRGFAISCLRSERNYPFSVAFYFNQIKSEALLTAADRNLVPIRGADENEFLQHVRSQCNIELTGLINLSTGRMLTIGNDTIKWRVSLAMETD